MKMIHAVFFMGCLVAGCHAVHPAARIDSHRRVVLERMEKTIIPGVNFQNSSMDQALTFLKQASVLNAPTSLGSDPEPIYFTAPSVGLDNEPLPPITFKIEEPISMSEVLQLVCKIAGCKVRVREHFIEIIKLVQDETQGLQNKVSDAISEPAPDAGSSPHQD